MSDQCPRSWTGIFSGVSLEQLFPWRASWAAAGASVAERIMKGVLRVKARASWEGPKFPAGCENQQRQRPPLSPLRDTSISCLDSAPKGETRLVRSRTVPLSLPSIPSRFMTSRGWGTSLSLQLLSGSCRPEALPTAAKKQQVWESRGHIAAEFQARENELLSRGLLPEPSDPRVTQLDSISLLQTRSGHWEASWGYDQQALPHAINAFIWSAEADSEQRGRCVLAC